MITDNFKNEKRTLKIVLLSANFFIVGGRKMAEACAVITTVCVGIKSFLTREYLFLENRESG